MIQRWNGEYEPEVYHINPFGLSPFATPLLKEGDWNYAFTCRCGCHSYEEENSADDIIIICSQCGKAERRRIE